MGERMSAKILVANRGEIACRVFRTAKSMGFGTVAVYSDADQGALHVSMADEAVHVGGSASSDSYLNQHAVIAAAKATGATHIHPGYGFLSENGEFAALCEQEGINFIGPPSAAIHAMGSKSAAKAIMQKAGVPLVPGYHEQDQTLDVLKKAADEIGYPVLLKAVAGGGGRGMRPVYAAEEFETACQQAQREAQSSFGNSVLLIEKYLPRARHVEVQVFCDKHGNGIYLGDRDCSIQRRHQKVVEEAPAPGISATCRAQMGEAAVKAAQAIDYVGAGTVEFLVDDSRGEDDIAFYFMEMNTRLQVEHPVTENITGLDLVQWQINIANGESLPLNQEQVRLSGHSVEVRLYAEDAYNDYCPSTGTLTHLAFPPERDGIRIDTGFVQGDEVSPFYDAMLAKVIAFGSNRSEAIRRLQRALDATQVAGCTTNAQWLRRVIAEEDFLQAKLHTQFLPEHKHLAEKPENSVIETHVVPWFLVVSRVQQTQKEVSSPWLRLPYWRVNSASCLTVELTVNGEEVCCSGKIHSSVCDGPLVGSLEVDGKLYELSGVLQGSRLALTINGQQHRYQVVDGDSAIGQHYLLGANNVLDIRKRHSDNAELDSAQGESGACTAPMNARVMEVLVKAGDEVSAGQSLLILEAMKMEYSVTAPVDGVVNEIFYGAGDLVVGGAQLIRFEE